MKKLNGVFFIMDIRKIPEDMMGGPSILFTQKAVVDVCKSTLGIDANQLYPFSIDKDMKTGLWLLKFLGNQIRLLFTQREQL